METQHDDHIWLTVGCSSWAIREINHEYEYIALWRGYEPNIEYWGVWMPNFNYEEYCDRAVKMMEGKMNEEVENNMTLIERIRSAINEAGENGYDTNTYTDDELACDLLAYEVSVENETYEAVLKAVKEVRHHD
jgi:hypothetical protein